MVNGSGTCSNVFVPDEVKKVIYNQHSPIAFCNEEDKPIWTHSHTGKFTIGSAWRELRQERFPNDMDSLLWHQNIPFKM